MIVFDYIFYRVAKFFFKKDGTGGVRAILTVSMIQGLLAIEILIFLITKFYHKPLNQILPTSTGKITTLSFAFLLVILNHVRYNKKYWILDGRWKVNENEYLRMIRGVLVIIAILSPLILLILSAFFSKWLSL